MLAIIVILAIIAVITVPVILNIIDNAKQGAARVSATGYIRAVENQLMINGMDTDPDNDIRSDCSKTAEQLETIYGVSVNGEKPLNKSTVDFVAGEVVGYKLYINGYIVTKVKDVITVVKDDNSNVPVQSITGLDAITMTVGEERTITASVLPTDATNKALSYTGYDTNIITISNGKITGVAPGTTTITVTSVSDSSITGTISVTVNSNTIALTKIALSTNSIDLNVSGTYTITPIFTPDNATNKGVSYSVSPSNTDIIEIVGGNVVGKTPGTATVIVTSNENSSISTQLELTVYKIDVADVQITESNFNLLIGAEKQLYTTVTPNDATDKNIMWTSNKPSVASVNENTGVVNGIAEGNAMITATSIDNNTIMDVVYVNVSASTPVCSLVSKNIQNTAADYKISFPGIDGIIYSTGDKYKCTPWTVKSSTQEQDYLYFYILDVDNTNKNISLLAEQNISGTSTMGWSAATEYLSSQGYTTSWNKVDSVTLPTAQQIAVAGKVYDLGSWNQNSGPSFYGATSSKDDYFNRSNYAWLYDYTKNCKTENMGCNYQTTSGAKGYWTSTSIPIVVDSFYFVYYAGKLDDLSKANTLTNGVRPVITLSSSKISQTPSS